MTSIFLSDGERRRYACGPLLNAVSNKADEEETVARYGVSERCMQARLGGVGAQSHEANDEFFRVVEVRPEVLGGEARRAVAPGAFLHISAGVADGFDRSNAPARLLTVFIPGGQMPAIAEWSERHG